MRLNLTVNNQRTHADEVAPNESLLHTLRERLGLPGSKNACEQGECGSCTVYLDDVSVPAGTACGYRAADVGRPG